MKLLAALLLSSVLAAQQPNTFWATMLPSVPASSTQTVTIPPEGGFAVVEVRGVPFADFVIVATPGTCVPNIGWCSGWFVCLPETTVIEVGQTGLSGTQFVWFQVAPLHPIEVTVQAWVQCPAEFIPSPPTCATGNYEPVPSQLLYFQR